MFQSLEVLPTAHSQTLFTTSEWYTTKYHDAFLQVILARYERHRLINGVIGMWEFHFQDKNHIPKRSASSTGRCNTI
jgi:hypothetical protein